MSAGVSPIGLNDVERASAAAVAALDESFFRVRFDQLTRPGGAICGRLPSWVRDRRVHAPPHARRGLPGVTTVTRGAGEPRCVHPIRIRCTIATMFLPLHDPPAPARTTYTPTAGAPLGLPPLDGSVRADVAIVGGGIAGCSAALHAAEAGARVVLVEANEIGWGASGRNAGHVPPATKHDPDEVLARYGAAAGQRVIDAAEQGPEVIAGLIARHGIDCGFSRPGIIMAAHSEAAFSAMTRRVEYWQARGRPVELLDRRAAAEAIGSNYYLGAWIDRRGGKINPLAYVRGLARAALKAGAALHEGTRATRLERSGTRWALATPRGRIEADPVLLCTNAYTDDLWPGLRATIVPVRAWQFASKPLSANVRRTILPGGQPMTDSRRLLSGIRLHRRRPPAVRRPGPAFGAEGEPTGGRRARACSDCSRRSARSRPSSGGPASWR